MDFFSMPNEIRMGIINRLREMYPKGARVVLTGGMADDPHGVPVGTEGTVSLVDDIGTVHVKWDNGSSLGVVYGQDHIRKV